MFRVLFSIGWTLVRYVCQCVHVCRTDGCSRPSRQEFSYLSGWSRARVNAGTLRGKQREKRKTTLHLSLCVCLLHCIFQRPGTMTVGSFVASVLHYVVTVLATVLFCLLHQRADTGGRWYPRIRNCPTSAKWRRLKPTESYRTIGTTVS